MISTQDIKNSAWLALEAIQTGAASVIDITLTGEFIARSAGEKCKGLELSREKWPSIYDTEGKAITAASVMDLFTLADSVILSYCQECFEALCAAKSQPARVNFFWRACHWYETKGQLAAAYNAQKRWQERWQKPPGISKKEEDTPEE